jgi:Zn-dependent metalloprotease
MTTRQRDGFIPAVLLLRAWQSTGNSVYLNTIMQMAKLHDMEKRMRASKKWQRRNGLIVPAADGPTAKRQVYNCHESFSLPGDHARFEGEKPANEAHVDRVFELLGGVKDFLWQTVGRNSIDGKGIDLKGCVNYGKRYNNAFYNMIYMVFGNGDGDIFVNFIEEVIIAHELYHGVTGEESALEYEGQSGANNEMLSDCNGVTFKQWKLKQKSSAASWLVGEGCFNPKFPHALALRSMKEPGSAYDIPGLGKDPQPGHMKDYVVTDDDNGGVHTNSGIPNKAFCMAALLCDGYTWETVFPVWHFTNTGKLRVSSTANFQDFANRTVQVCTEIGSSKYTDKVVKAWDMVGITVK